MPGPEIHASSIDTILRGFPLSAAAGWVNVAIIVLLGMAAPLMALRISALKAVLITAALVAIFAVVAQLLFNGGVILSLVYAGIGALLSTIATMVIYGMTTAFERERVREVFGRFVPESVVGQVLDQADGARLGGIQTSGTVLFSDLRGFTSFAEPRAPDQVIEILNRYLTAMSDAILDHGGTLVAYMGDGIMAVFGAPVEQEDHADRALAASVDMLKRLDDFNQWLRDEQLADGFKMGIGLNSGNVMSGNVGSERRLEYTAIGDTTNTAARLEGMTKGTPYQLYLADSTRAALRVPVEDLTQVGDFEVRGREAKIRLWTLPSTQHEEPARSAAPVTA
jgi:adenylate cyclase